MCGELLRKRKSGGRRRRFLQLVQRLPLLLEAPKVWAIQQLLRRMRGRRRKNLGEALTVTARVAPLLEDAELFLRVVRQLGRDIRHHKNGGAAMTGTAIICAPFHISTWVLESVDNVVCMQFQKEKKKTGVLRRLAGATQHRALSVAIIHAPKERAKESEREGFFISSVWFFFL